jgi:hypothetical protein
VFDWIIEADVYRLRKAAGEATDPRERREIENLAEHKLAVLRHWRAGGGEMPKRSPVTDLEYHLKRARAEREVAYRLGDGVAADAHMRLSALHLRRALLLQRVRTEPVGNVRPFIGAPAVGESSVPPPAFELQSIR